MDKAKAGLLVGELMELPILKVREDLVKAIRDNPVTIVVGETGSGKTTQIPQFLYEAGFANGKRIGITEPRRVAAISVAKFVAEELGVEVGTTVGYQIRFDDTTAEETKVKFMTDGILLREIQVDPDLNQYSVIMVDEAHERSQNIDFTLGLLKNLLQRRKDLKVVVASATIDHDKFSQYFWNAPVVNVSGRMYPVEIRWSEMGVSSWATPEEVVQQVKDIHLNEAPGDILVFMTGEDDIGRVVRGLEACNLVGVVVLPVYGNLPSDEQYKIFNSYPRLRKIVVATNIAETSITIDGIVYVVDSGHVKQSSFDPQTGIQSLEVVHHSQAGCNQRAGRAGRTQPGICYRLYTRESFASRPEFTVPEIQRSSLASVVLAMEEIGLDDIPNFDFVDPPEKVAFHEAYETLIALGAIKRGEKGLTEVGRAMARLPLEPRTARMLIEAQKFDCVEAVATIAAFLSVRNIFLRPKGKEYEADRAHRAFRDSRSDMLTSLSVWKAFEESNFSLSWCFDNFLNGKMLQEAGSVRRQLIQVLEKSGVPISANGSEEQIMKAVAAGLVYSLFRHSSRHHYSSVVRENYMGAYIHPSSAVFSSGPSWFVAADVVETSKVYARGCSEVEIGWLPEIIPSLAKFEEDGVIVRVLPGIRGAVVRRGIIFRELLIGYAEVEVSLEEAHRIQDKAIQDATAKGLISLVFSVSEPKGPFGFDRYVTSVNGTVYQSTDWYATEPGVMYYCRIQPSWGEEVNVSPVVKTFDLPPLPEQSEAEKTIQAVDLKALADKWGARVSGKE